MRVLQPLASPPAESALISQSCDIAPLETTPASNPMTNRDAVQSHITVDNAEKSSAIFKGRIPRVDLDGEAITDAMAARLATCLLGHVLFLKNQVPL
jgi:hypothetical protein